MASTKKTGSSKAKTSGKKPTEPRAEDVTKIEETPKDGDTAPIVEDTPAAQTASADEPTVAAAEGGTEKDATTETAKEESGAETVSDADATESPAEPDAATEEPKSDTGPADAEPEEPKTETRFEPVTQPAPVAPAAAAAPRNNTFLPLVLGGIIAGVIGFAAAEFDILSSGSGEDETAALQQVIDAQAARIDALEAAEPAPVEIPEVDLSGIESQLSEIDERIAALEARPLAAAPEGMDAQEAQTYITELGNLQQAVQAQRAEIEELIANARSVEEATAEAARAANAQAALSKIVSAIDAGQPFAEELSTLSEAATAPVDPALETAAADGVPTLSALQADFAEQARAALSASRSSGGDSQSVGGFLRQQLGVRSVTPREGDDPDAILSRAEAAVQAGDLDTALSELDALPEAGKSAMSDWLSGAQLRANARQAADELAQSLTAD